MFNSLSKYRNFKNGKTTGTRHFCRQNKNEHNGGNKKFNSIKLTMIGLSETEADRSRAQTVEEYLKVVVENEMVYKDSPMYVARILSYEIDIPIENW